jgi:UDP-N-acetylglucosamine diphosphorylase / glucose-1-phosphate thymidylyltransferase / UDP-N-acetylgalactosamine diphosphorylase / glucosamine-1-phosphate N-acetyltransferase / galactosamine-1-phosphate N-acetyltransferase
MSSPLSLDLFVDKTSVLAISQDLLADPIAFLGQKYKGWLKEFLSNKGAQQTPILRGKVSPLAQIEGQVYIEEGAEVGPFCYIQGPTYVARGAEIRHGAFLRGQCYIGEGAVVGHTTEVKNAIFFPKAKAAHFAYIGDSILGSNVNLGAGTKLANVKVNHGLVKVKHPVTDKILETGLKKFGAILGDDAQTGCNSVLSPGTLLMPKTAVYPCAHFHGTLKSGIFQ